MKGSADGYDRSRSVVPSKRWGVLWELFLDGLGAGAITEF